MRLFKISDVDGRKARFRCECGNTKTLYKSNVAPHKTRSCGCLRREATALRSTTHGHSAGYRRTRTYVCWKAMRQRCSNPNRPEYPNYGARGISVCERWAEYEMFLEDMGEAPAGMSIDRIDVNGDYEPTNCRWASPLQQGNNKRINRMIEHGGERLTLAEWARRAGVKYHTLMARLDSGMSVDRALSTSANMRWSDRPFQANDATNGLIRLA